MPTVVEILFERAFNSVRRMDWVWLPQAMSNVEAKKGCVDLGNCGRVVSRHVYPAF